MGLKPGYDYSHLDENGMIQENTQLNDKNYTIKDMETKLKTLEPEVIQFYGVLSTLSYEKKKINTTK